MFKLEKKGHIINILFMNREVWNLKIDINEKAKIIAIWCSNQENLQKNLPINIEKEIESYKQKKYKICIYQSGNDDIKRNLLNLVINNV